MSLPIDSLDDLKALLKACKLNIANVDDVQGLLRAVNANYNPDAARVRVAKQLGVIVPSVALGAAGGVSFFLVGTEATSKGPYGLACFAVMWGVVGLVCMIATIFSCAVLLSRRAAPAPAGPPAFNGPTSTAFTERPANRALPGERG
jgi:hypothetical protein